MRVTVLWGDTPSHSKNMDYILMLFPNLKIKTHPGYFPFIDNTPYSLSVLLLLYSCTWTFFSVAIHMTLGLILPPSFFRLLLCTRTDAHLRQKVTGRVHPFCYIPSSYFNLPKKVCRYSMCNGCGGCAEPLPYPIPPGKPSVWCVRRFLEPKERCARERYPWHISYKRGGYGWSGGYLIRGERSTVYKVGESG